MEATNKSSSAQEPLFDIGDLLLLIWNKKYRIIFTAGALFALLGYYVLQLPRIYIATTTLQLGNASNEMSLPQGLASFASGGDSKLDTYLQYMRSRQFTERVVEDSGLMHRAELVNQNQSDDKKRLDAAIRLQRGLAYSRLGETAMVNVSFESTSPQLAADVVNAVGPTFFAYQTRKSTARSADASRWLNQQFEEVQVQLEQSEAALQDYFLENKLIDLASQISLASSEISTYMSQRIQVDAQAAEMKTMISQFDASGDDIQGLLNVSYIIKNSMVQDLRKRILDEEEDLAEISRRYKYKHPRYIAQVSKIEAMKRELDSLVRKLVASLKQEYKIYLERSEEINKLIEEARGRHSELGQHEVNLAKLRREVESTQKLYDIFLSRVQETEILRDLGSQDDFSVIDYASVPTAPSKPNVVLLLAASVVFSLFISVMGWLFIHIVSDKRSRTLKILESMEVPVVTNIPRLAKGKRKLSDVLVASHENMPFAEAIRTLRTNLIVRNESEENRVIAVTGVKPNDGKSLVAASLAESFAKLEKSLILDADLRYPSISGAFNMSSELPGLTHFIGKQQPAGRCIHRIQDGQLSMMPSGHIPQDPMVYLSKPRFKAFLHKLSIIFERVVIDVPPLEEFSDALVISRNVDAIILVCDLENCETAELVQAVQKLRDVGAPLLGVVFNRVKNVPTRIRGTNRRPSLIKRFGGKHRKPKSPVGKSQSIRLVK
ncbi:GumC family protein [Alteromonas flava]|uniref:GumC family protein n=1 Tax=Alteromonas flava TaxID=2048003 RepID=UPI000C28A0E6|nr:polysaccharide biosynthesis tyrosine autokinase [Alteromonas flava]